MKLSEIKSIFDYNFWAFDRVWQCISQISDARIIARKSWHYFIIIFT